MNENFAFESAQTSIAFNISCGALGDTLIAKSVFDALVKIAPNCKIDIFSTEKPQRDSFKRYVKSFYGYSRNLNLVSNDINTYSENASNYDLAVSVWHVVSVDAMNEKNLQSRAPELFQSAQKIKLHNSKGYNRLKGSSSAIVLFNIRRAHILGINRYTCLSCDGALPIYNNRVAIPLYPEGERAFQKLGLSKNYITIGSNLSKDSKEHRHSLKEWPVSHVTEYVSLLNRYIPQLEIVQIGGGGVYKIPNADRYIFDADLEVVKYVLKNSLLHVDCESGPVHLATQLGTKCLVLFGPTDEKYYGFRENLNVVSGFCYPCIHAWNDGSTCLRGAEEPPCMLNITPQLVYNVTYNYLSHLKKNKA